MTPQLFEDLLSRSGGGRSGKPFYSHVCHWGMPSEVLRFIYCLETHRPLRVGLLSQLLVTGHTVCSKIPQVMHWIYVIHKPRVQKWSFYDPFWSYCWTSWSGLHFMNRKVPAISHLSELTISLHPPHSPLPTSPPLARPKSVWMSFLSFVTEWDLIWSPWF